jgi:tRNA-intron endonuclease
MTAKQSLTADYSEGQVIISDSASAQSLLEAGYGSAKNNGKECILSPWEALYLLAEDRLQVQDGQSQKLLTFQTLLTQYRKEDEEVWTKYLIYRDLRSRGYVVRDGFGLGVDFRLYARGTYGQKAAKYLVYTLCEGTPMVTKKLRDIHLIAQNMKKQLIIAVMDRRGEIVYYSLGSFHI